MTHNYIVMRQIEEKAMNEIKYNCKIKFPENSYREVLAELNRCNATLDEMTGIENYLIYCEIIITEIKLKEFESWFSSEIGGSGEIIIAA